MDFATVSKAMIASSISPQTWELSAGLKYNLNVKIAKNHRFRGTFTLVLCVPYQYSPIERVLGEAFLYIDSSLYRACTV